MPENDNEIKITDKRKFDKDGNIKQTDQPAIQTENKGATTTDSKAGDAGSANVSGKTIDDYTYDKNSIDFMQFILSLYTSILATLGELSDPSTKIEKNPEQAKELIDIITMLQEKTRGNLTAEEQQALDEILYQSKMIYLKNSGGIKL